MITAKELYETIDNALAFDKILSGIGTTTTWEELPQNIKNIWESIAQAANQDNETVLLKYTKLHEWKKGVSDGMRFTVSQDPEEKITIARRARGSQSTMYTNGLIAVMTFVKSISDATLVADDSHLSTKSLQEQLAECEKEVSENEALEKEVSEDENSLSNWGRIIGAMVSAIPPTDKKC